MRSADVYFTREECEGLSRSQADVGLNYLVWIPCQKIDIFTEFVYIWPERKKHFLTSRCDSRGGIRVKKSPQIPIVNFVQCEALVNNCECGFLLHTFLHMIFLRITYIFTSHGKITAIHFLGQTLPPSWSVLSSSLLHRKDKCSRESDTDIGSSSLRETFVVSRWLFPAQNNFRYRTVSPCSFNCSQRNTLFTSRYPARTWDCK